MTLQKAIEIAEDENRFHPRVHGEDRFDAFQLLIEAGKREIRNRDDPDYVIAGILKGETKE